MNSHRSAQSALAGVACFGSLIAVASALSLPAEAQTKFKYDKQTYAPDSKRGHALPNVYGDAKEKEWNALRPAAAKTESPIRDPNPAAEAQSQNPAQPQGQQTGRRAPDGYDLLMGHYRDVKLVGIQTSYGAPGAIDTFFFETPFSGPRGQKWVGFGCGMKAIDHPYLLEAFRDGHIVGLNSTGDSCVTTYSVRRNGAAQQPAANAPGGPNQRSDAAPPRNTNVAAAPQPSQPQMPESQAATPAGDEPSSSVNLRTSALTLTGTGASADIAARFAPVELRTSALTLTGSGASSDIAAGFTPQTVRTGALTLVGVGTL